MEASDRTPIQSWGRLKTAFHRVMQPHEATQASKWVGGSKGPLLAHGLGRSYGDSCLNDGGDLLLTGSLDRFIKADWKTGIVRVEAGMSLDALLKACVPNGFFIPVTPGTMQVTVGGCVANDVHGKNHHSAGTFGCHVKALGLWRSNQAEVLTCSEQENPDLFRATIGGLGLTGFIVWVELLLIPIRSPFMEVDQRRFADLDGFLELSEQSDQRFTYTVAWVDLLSPKLRGVFFRGNHSQQSAPLKPHPRRQIQVPLTPPVSLLGSFSLKVFNQLYYATHGDGQGEQHYRSFFYPLDGVGAWNRLYGPNGFYQFQFVIPLEALENLRTLVSSIQGSGHPSFLGVLKKFGKLSSPGLLSFPQEGFTLAADFPNHGQKSLQLLRHLETLVLEAGGRLYPAKDSMMSAAGFAAGYPELEEFQRLQDPLFLSDFARRVGLGS